MSYEIIQPGNSEYVEKKSRFIGILSTVGSEEEALEFIKAKKKQYYDARHNCYAYIIADSIARSSDDGEPGGTAGRPILDVMEHAGIVNAVLVVTRYFGGVLLGTGGLTRAYSEAAKGAVADAVLMQRVEGRILTIGTDYNGYGKIEYILRQEECPVTDTQYDSGVTVTAVCPEEKHEALVKRITDETAAQARIEVSDPIVYGDMKGKIEIL